MRKKIAWQFLQWHKGVAIVTRPGLQRRGYASIYHNAYCEDNHIGWFIHHTVETAQRHIEKLNKDLGDKCHITKDELEKELI